MVSVILSIAGLVLAGALAIASWRVVGVLSHKNEPPVTVAHQVDPTAGMSSAAEAILAVEARLDKLTMAVADGIERVHRAENRINKTVTSARRLVREAGLEHAGVEAEYEELQPAHDEGIEPLPPMPEEVDGPRAVRIPGGHLEIGAA